MLQYNALEGAVIAYEAHGNSAGPANNSSRVYTWELNAKSPLSVKFSEISRP